MYVMLKPLVRLYECDCEGSSFSYLGGAVGDSGRAEVLLVIGMNKIFKQLSAIRREIKMHRSSPLLNLP